MADSLGRELRRLRTEKLYGTRELARKVRVSASTLCRVECDELLPSEAVIGRLCKVLCGDRDELLRLAKRVPADVERVLFSRPGLFAKVRRWRGPRSSATSAESRARSKAPSPR